MATSTNRPPRRTPAMWAAGADPEHIVTLQERARITSMGCMVLAIALAAMCSMTAALTLSFPGHLAWLKFLPVGVLWAFIVLSLDRWIVSIVTVDRLEAGEPAQSAGARRRGAIGLFLARATMAFLVGAVISEPLVMALFAGEINTEIQAIHDKQLTDQTAKIRQKYAAQRAANDGQTQQLITRTQQLLASRTAALTSLTADATEKHDIYLCEHNFTGPTCAKLRAAAKVTGHSDGNAATEGPQTRQAHADWNRAVALLAPAQRAVAVAQTAYDKAVAAQPAASSDLVQKQKDDVAAAARTIAADHGLLIREQALSNLMAHNRSVFWTRWAVFAALIVVDLMPLALKSMTSRSPYSVAASAAAVRRVRNVRALAELEADSHARDVRHRIDSAAVTAMLERERDDEVDLEVAAAAREQRRLRRLAEVDAYDVADHDTRPFEAVPPRYRR